MNWYIELYWQVPRFDWERAAAMPHASALRFNSYRRNATENIGSTSHRTKNCIISPHEIPKCSFQRGYIESFWYNLMIAFELMRALYSVSTLGWQNSLISFISHISAHWEHDHYAGKSYGWYWQTLCWFIDILGRIIGWQNRIELLQLWLE
jgi:hypothetical protein